MNPHNPAAAANAAALAQNLAANPCLSASEPTTNGAAALASRPVL